MVAGGGSSGAASLGNDDHRADRWPSRRSLAAQPHSHDDNGTQNLQLRRLRHGGHFPHVRRLHSRHRDGHHVARPGRRIQRLRYFWFVLPSKHFFNKLVLKVALT